jgi:hypothetical protein
VNSIWHLQWKIRFFKIALDEINRIEGKKFKQKEFIFPEDKVLVSLE